MKSKTTDKNPPAAPATPAKKRPNMRSFEADPDVAGMIDDAVASGAILKDIVNAALRIYGPEVLAERVKELRKTADAIEKKIGAGKR